MSVTSLALRVPEPLEAGALAALRALLPPPAPCPPRLSTGIAALDAVLPGRGIPRGRLTELAGRPGSGQTTVLREMVMATIAGGVRAAVVDAARMLAPRDWARGDDDDPLVIRPRDATLGPWCADVLLRSGAFALVVLDGAPVVSSAIATRLTRLARDANVALVITTSSVPAHGRPPAPVPSALRLHVARVRTRRRSAITITVEKGGGSGGSAGGRRATVEVEYVVAVAHRVCPHPEIPDRRGVAREGARECTTAGNDARRVLPRKRRCAEPAFGSRSGTVG